MTSNKYTIHLTGTFKEELKEILYYIKNRLKEPLVAKRFYKSVIQKINSLKFMPDRYKTIENIYNKTEILRKVSVDNYVIIYEINDTRTNFHSTYFSW